MSDKPYIDPVAEHERQRRAKDVADLANERARELWERCVVAILESGKDKDYAVSAADTVVIRWQERWGASGGRP